MRFEFTGALLMASLASQANAWWGTPHLLIARIAEFILKDEAPNSLAAAKAELQTLKDSNPSLTSHEGDHIFTECSNFADTIKGEGYSFQSDWHYIDQPYIIDGTDASNYNMTMSNTDIYGALTTLTMWLQDTGAYAQTTYYDQIMDKMTDDADGRSFALRLIIHYVADIHNPFHAVIGFSDQFSSGDHGGNYESIPSTSCGASNLHAVWDSVLYEYCDDQDLPFDTDGWSWTSNEAANLRYGYPVDDSEILGGQFHLWAAESYDMAKQYGYDDVTSGSSLSDEYINDALPVVKAYMALAGHRLADLIQQIYPNDSSSLFLQ